MRWVATFIAAIAIALLGAGAATAAAPRIVIVSGGPLKHQVAIANWLDIFHVIEQVAQRPAVVSGRGQLGSRPRLRFSMFWGPRWNEYLRTGHKAGALRPRQADQQGAFYPAWRGLPALMDLPWAGSWPRVVPAKALAILKRHGVPVRLS